MPTNPQRWRIGELAAATGLTVRTLHHYEQIGLLSAPARTDSGHRLFDADDVQRLYRIRALRELGLSLPEISAALDADGGSLAEVLRAHLRRAEQELERLARLRDRLAALCTADAIAADQLLAAIEGMSHVEHHVKVRARPTHGLESDWRALADALRARIAAGDTPDTPAVRAIAGRAQAAIRAFANDDPATVDALATIRRVAPPIGLAGWDAELFAFLDRALDQLAPSRK